MKTYRIKFGTAFDVDGFGFVGTGKLSFTDIELLVEGPRHWSVFARVLVYLCIFLPIALLTIVSKGGYGTMAASGIGALAAVHYACVSPGSVKWHCDQVQGVFRWGRNICFSAPAPDSGKLRKALIRASDQDAAAEIETLLMNKLSKQ
jgi:hypothetical protein